MIDLFVFNTSTDIDPAIFAEFAHVVYRFGHSMLTENSASTTATDRAVGRRSADATRHRPDRGFLNPSASTTTAPTSRRSTRPARSSAACRVSVGNEIDEFVVDALRNNLLGLPLDLAALNIARGRDTGIRRSTRRASSSTRRATRRPEALRRAGPTSRQPQEPGLDRQLHRGLWHARRRSLPTTTLAGKRDAAMTLVFGDGTQPAADVAA